MMETLTTHPSNAVEANAFTAPHSLSFPGGVGHITPPSENGLQSQTNGQITGKPAVNGSSAADTGATPATPAATPGAGQGVSGIIPTLQNLVATVNLDCRVRISAC
jgi:transcription initiation factor TFIID TATA-box-binding protein